MKTIWLIEEGIYFDDMPYDTVVCELKKIAIKKCRDDGFKYNSKQDLWCNDKEEKWRHVIRTEFYT